MFLGLKDIFNNILHRFGFLRKVTYLSISGLKSQIVSKLFILSENSRRNRMELDKKDNSEIITMNVGFNIDKKELVKRIFKINDKCYDLYMYLRANTPPEQYVVCKVDRAKCLKQIPKLKYSSAIYYCINTLVKKGMLDRGDKNRLLFVTDERYGLDMNTKVSILFPYNRGTLPAILFFSNRMLL